MRKNCKFRLRLETEMLDKLKKEAEELDMTVSGLVRQKLNSSSKLNRILLMLEDIHKKLI
jgi:hypothetical protein